MQINLSYDKDFELLINKLKNSESGQELAEVDGIGSQIDINNFSKNFFRKKTTVDVSVDANANVDDIGTIQYKIEAGKPLHRLNSYYLLRKYGKQFYNKETAEDMVTAQFYKTVYINDFHTFGYASYSYFEDTVIILKINDELITTTMIDLFKEFEDLKME